MTNDEILIHSALSVWRLYDTRIIRAFHPLSEAELQKEVAPGRNRLLYLWGHLTAVSDSLFPLLTIGPKLYPDLESMFLSNPDGAVSNYYTGAQVKEASAQIHQALWHAFNRWTVREWLAPHAAAKHLNGDPTRNRFSVMVNRTAHMAYHLGQAILAKPDRLADATG